MRVWASFFEHWGSLRWPCETLQGLPWVPMPGEEQLEWQPGYSLGSQLRAWELQKGELASRDTWAELPFVEMAAEDNNNNKSTQ